MRESVNIEIVEPTKELLSQIAYNIRSSDEKLTTMWGTKDVVKSVLNEFDSKNVVCVGLLNKEPFVAVCVRPMAFISKQAFMWLIATPKLYKAPVAVMRKSLYYIDKLASVFESLVAYIDTKDKLAMKYAKSLGFQATGNTFMVDNKQFEIVERKSK